MFQFLSLQSLSTSLHSKATEVSSIRSNCAIRANQSFVTHCSFSAEGLPRRSKASCGKAMASCFFTNVWNPDISHGHGHLMISNPCLQNSFTGSCRALQSNLLFMMSPHKVPVKRCFSLCNTENFFLFSGQFSLGYAQHFLFLFSSFFFLLGNPISQLFIYGHFYLFLFLLNCSFSPDVCTN